MNAASPFKDAEAWLAERGIEPDPIQAAPPAPADVASSAVPEGPEAASHPPVVEGSEGAQPAADEADDAGVQDAEVTKAVSFIRSSTAAAPQSEGRVRDKLARRGVADEVIDAALVQARGERLVDDAAMAGAFVAERRAKGHAPLRIRQDMVRRGFDADTIAGALAPAEAEDQEAAAFAVARDRAAQLTGVEPQKALRRLIGHLARRGYPEGLARKVARDAIYATRQDQRTAES